MAAKREAVEIGGVRLTSPDKVLYPEQGTTKRGLAEYYLAVAEWMLPHVARRPITLVRCPSGRATKCFYQRHAGSGVPAELGQVDIAGFEESGAYLYIKDAKGLVALVQMGVLEVHPWGALIDQPERPDRVILDLDPGEGLGFADVVEQVKPAVVSVRIEMNGERRSPGAGDLEGRNIPPGLREFFRQFGMPDAPNMPPNVPGRRGGGTRAAAAASAARVAAPAAGGEERGGREEGSGGTERGRARHGRR